MFRLALAHGSRHAHASTTSVFPSPVGMGSTSGSPFRATSTCQRYGFKPPVAISNHSENWSSFDAPTKLLIIHPFGTRASPPATTARRSAHGVFVRAYGVGP